MKKRSRKTGISLRLPNDIIDAVDIEVDAEKFPSFTDAIEHYVRRGQLLDSLTAINKDPEKKKELEEKLAKILGMDDIERTMETCEIDDLKVIRAMADDKIKAKFHQLVLQVKSS